MAPISRWCAVTDTPCPGLQRLGQYLDLDGLHVYYRGPDGSRLGPDGPIELDLRTLLAPADRDADEPRSTLRIGEHEITIRISALNTDPVYAVADRRRGHFAYFTDLFLAPLLLCALGQPVDVADGPVDHPRGTRLRGVDRLLYDSVTTVRREAGQPGSRWTISQAEEPDPLGEFLAPHRNDPAAAGLAQIEALAGRLARIKAADPGSGFATLLSGGIDSGTVTCLAVEAGLSVAPYSIGTPWGDEFGDAAELCAHLGIELHPVRLSAEEIIASIPETVRWLGTAEAESVEVALTATCVQRLGIVPAGLHLLTGYGSDLINAGLYRPFDDPAELIGQVLGAVDRTRLSNELSNQLALAYSAEVDHPFWSWPVMRVALETAPECKVRDGREKFHLRTAMQGRVPEAIAWRRKIAVHHGGGLQQGVARWLEQETGVTDRAALYRACFAELAEAAQTGALEPADPWPLFERTVRRVRAVRSAAAAPARSREGADA